LALKVINNPRQTSGKNRQKQVFTKYSLLKYFHSDRRISPRPFD